MELELPRLLAPDLPSNCSSLRDLNCTHSNCKTQKSSASVFIVTTSPCRDWVICAPAAFLGCGSRFSGSLSGLEPLFPVRYAPPEINRGDSVCIENPSTEGPIAWQALKRPRGARLRIGLPADAWVRRRTSSEPAMSLDGSPAETVCHGQRWMDPPVETMCGHYPHIES